MGFSTKSIYIVALTILVSVSCSKVFTSRGEQPIAEEAQDLDTLLLSPTEVEVCDTLEEASNDRLNAADTLSISDIITIPSECDSIALIHFSEEQSSSVMIPEYQDVEIEDMALMFTQYDSTAFHYPIKQDSYVTSQYGWRRGRMHAGVDLKVLTGDELYAAFDGVIRLAKYNGGYGYCVVIRHDNGLETLYGHCSKILVKVDQRVKAGDVIALGGNTGRSSGSHLHFEVRLAGRYLNPNLVIDTKNSSLQDKNLYITLRKGRLFASNDDSAEAREAAIIEELSIKYYTVRSGDVLSRIAANNHTTVSTLCKLNNISSKSILRIGQRLIVRAGIKPTTTTAASSSSASSSSASSSASLYHTVKRGDTLSSIARNNSTSVSVLCQLNRISSRSTLQIGQKVRVN